MDGRYQAVLLLAFGGPACRQEVRQFVLNVASGRSISQGRIETVIEQYREIGGKSPFKELTQRQALALESALAGRAGKIPVMTGYLYCSPFIAETVKQLASMAVSHVMAIVMAPHRTQASFDRYVKAVNKTLASYPGAGLQIDFAPAWHRHPLYIEAVTERICEKLEEACLSPDASTRLIFTAHSVPTSMSDASGYAREIDETARLVAKRLGWRNWQVAYQSRSGSPTAPWLEPDVREAIACAARQGMSNVVIVPIGFVCDHVEVLFDLDVQAYAVAGDLGVAMHRVKTVGDHGKFITMLADLIVAGLDIRCATLPPGSSASSRHRRLT